MHHRFGSVILDTAFRYLIPFILVFAVYVLVWGEYSPGGGFQAGVLLAVAVILVRLVRGEESRWGISRNAAVALASAGTLIYAGMGLITSMLGGNVLDYGVLPVADHPAEARALGILGIEIGVTTAIMGVFVLIFDLLAKGE